MHPQDPSAPVCYATGRSMTTLVKIQRKGQMTLPSSFRHAMGVAEGSLVELSLKNGKTVITPRAAIDPSRFPNADDEYTPAQRRAIKRGIAQSENEYNEGHFFGPFDNHEDFIASLHREAGKLGVKKNKRPKK
jgi:AbrB family looped-hinge helix DNA binding protein